MFISTSFRRVALASAVAVAASIAVVAVPATGAGAAANSAAGIGTKSALNSPLCDPATGRIKIPAYLASVCVKPWKEGADNGGATYQGVTKDSIKVVVQVAPAETQLHPPGLAQAPKNRSTGQNGLLQDAILDAQAALDGRYELWGRKIDYEFVVLSGTDEASQRADAVTIAAKKPFAVALTVGGPILATELAKKKILVAWGSGNNEDNLQQQPYRFTGQDANLQAKNVATWIGKQIAGHPAKFAGDPAFQKQDRKFGLLYTTSATAGTSIDLEGFKKELTKNKVPKLAAEVAYTVPADAAQATTAAQEQAPTIIAKMKDAGVTSVILMGSSAIVGPVTNAATANDYRPEWLMTGWAYQDLTLLAGGYDKDQWAHAFGMAWFAPYATDNAGAVTADNVVDWYWGKNQATSSTGGMPLVYWLNQGFQLAGPKLTPTSFRDGEFAQPGTGGAYDDQMTTQGNKVGDLGLGYPEYSLLGPKDFALVWFDPKAEGKGNILGNTTTGNYVYLDGGKRYTLQTWKKGEPKFFQDLPTNVIFYTTSPAGELPPEYPCDGCPSQGGTQQPSAVQAS